jgi:gas vesicle protein
MEIATMKHEQFGTKLVWFFSGACAGATIALMTAPHNGRKMRRILQEKVDNGANSVADAGHELYERGRRLAKESENLVDRAAHMISR